LEEPDCIDRRICRPVALAPKYQAEAKDRAEQLAPVIREMQKRGYSMRGIANELKKFVKRIVERLASPVLQWHRA
jgi:hypothetical protein